MPEPENSTYHALVSDALIRAAPAKSGGFDRAQRPGGHMNDPYEDDIAAWSVQQAELLRRRAALLTLWIGDALDREAA